MIKRMGNKGLGVAMMLGQEGFIMIKTTICGCLLMAVSLGLCGCSEPVKDEPTPKYQGKDYKYHSKGADGYGPPNAVRKGDQ